MASGWRGLFVCVGGRSDIIHQFLQLADGIPSPRRDAVTEPFGHGVDEVAL